MTVLTEKEARNDLVCTYRHIVDIGLTELSSGNLSIRYRDGFLISPTGATGETINEDNVVYIAADDSWDPSGAPSSEWQLHSKIYRKDPATNAVIHTHSDNCVAVACHCRSLPSFHYLVGVFGGDDVPCVPYSTFGSEQLANDVADALVDRSACLMANHGMTARGASLKVAASLAQRLEILCRQYLLSQALGEPKTLSAQNIADFHHRIGNSGYGK